MYTSRTWTCPNQTSGVPASCHHTTGTKWGGRTATWLYHVCYHVWVIVVILATYCRLQQNKNSHCVAASLSYPDILRMPLIGTLLYRHAVITSPDIHYIIGTFCSRITFSCVVFDCTHAQANLWPLPSFVLIIPFLPLPPNACPQLIQWLLWLQLWLCWHEGCADVGSNIQSHDACQMWFMGQVETACVHVALPMCNFAVHVMCKGLPPEEQL